MSRPTIKGPATKDQVAALIPAAGLGTRLGLGPKALVKVAGKTLLERSIACLAPHVDQVWVALPAGFGPLPGLAAHFITGGTSRQESVLALLHACQAEVVLVHDAARPFLPSDVIRAVQAAVQHTGAATAALPVADTLVRENSMGQDLKVPQWGKLCPREHLWAVQTPQGFRRELLLAAHQKAQHDGVSATDDAGLVARLGVAVQLVPGDARLFKVTTPGDLALAEALAQQWDGERGNG